MVWNSRRRKIGSVRNNSAAHVCPSGCQPSRLVRSDGEVQCLGSLSWARPTSQRVFSFSQNSTGRLPPSVGTSRVSWCSATTWDLWNSRGLLPRRRRFSGSRPTEHMALYRIVRDFTSQGSGQRVRRPDNISSAMLTVAFSQSHCSRLISASVGFPCQRGVTSSLGWVLLPFHTVPPACSSKVGSALGERRGLTLVLSRVHVLFR